MFEHQATLEPMEVHRREDHYREQVETEVGEQTVAFVRELCQVAAQQGAVCRLETDAAALPETADQTIVDALCGSSLQCHYLGHRYREEEIDSGNDNQGCSQDKGKPFVRVGRKATDPQVTRDRLVIRCR